jgi:hypothetical protein
MFTRSLGVGYQRVFSGHVHRGNKLVTSCSLSTSHQHQHQLEWQGVVPLEEVIKTGRRCTGAPIHLRAGKVQLLLDGIDLRSVRVDGEELVNRV